MANDDARPGRPSRPGDGGTQLTADSVPVVDSSPTSESTSTTVTTNGKGSSVKNVPTGPGLRPTSSAAAKSAGAEEDSTRPVRNDAAARAFAAGAAARTGLIPTDRSADTTPADAEQDDATPAEAKPAGLKPAGLKPAESKPAESKPAVVKSAVTEPAKPADEKSPEIEPSAAKPVASTDAKPAARTASTPPAPSPQAAPSSQNTQVTQVTPVPSSSTSSSTSSSSSSSSSLSAGAAGPSRSVTEGRLPASGRPAPQPAAPPVPAAAPAARASEPFVAADRADRGGWDPGPSAEERFEQGYASSDLAPSGRVAQLTVSSINLWSVLKVSLMLSIAAGVALVIATSVLWAMLKGIGVFDQLNGVLGDAASQANGFDIYDYVGYGRVLSLSLLIAVVNVFLLMGFSIVVALIYNLAAGLVGGLRVTLSDD